GNGGNGGQSGAFTCNAGSIAGGVNLPYNDDGGIGGNGGQGGDAGGVTANNLGAIATTSSGGAGGNGGNGGNGGKGFASKITVKGSMQWFPIFGSGLNGASVDSIFGPPNIFAGNDGGTGGDGGAGSNSGATGVGGNGGKAGRGGNGGTAGAVTIKAAFFEMDDGTSGSFVDLFGGNGG